MQVAVFLGPRFEKKPKTFLISQEFYKMTYNVYED